MTMNISMTNAACEYIQAKITKDQGIGFRLSIKKTGCSGYAYYPTIIKEINSTDIVINVNPILNIFIDSQWHHLLQGLTIDYIEEEKSGLKQKRLVFTNPNEANRCGCGESFHV